MTYALISQAPRVVMDDVPDDPETVIESWYKMREDRYWKQKHSEGIKRPLKNRGQEEGIGGRI